MNSDLETEVFAKVSELTGVPPQKLTLETTLFHDLGMDGDDAVDFFEEFARTFRVDLTDFQVEKYFGPEGSEPLSAIATWLRGWWTGDYHKTAGVVPITLRELIETARLGRWSKS